MRLIIIIALVIGVMPSFVATDATAATTGSVVSQFTPVPSGNGRAVAFDGMGHLYHTLVGDTHIYQVDLVGSPISSCDVGVEIGALSWDASRHQLWAGAYDGSGKVFVVNFTKCTTKYVFAFVNSDIGSDYIDGIAYDSSDDTL